MRAATLTASACGITLAACLSACGNGSTSPTGSTSPPPAAQFVIAAMAPLLGFVVGEASRGPVKTHLEIAARYAALMEEAALGDHEEPAPVFTP